MVMEGDEQGEQWQQVKLSVTGKAGAGKTALIKALCSQAVPAQHTETLGLQVSQCRRHAGTAGAASSDVGTQFSLWEVGAASAVRQPHLLAAARDSATVTLVVFSMTDLSSFKALPAMLDELKGDTIFLVATKMDLVASCSVSLAAAHELAKQRKASLLLVSNPPFTCQPSHRAKCAPSPAFTNTAFTEIAIAVEQKLW